MNFTEIEYLALLRGAFPKDFLRALLQGVVTAHRAAPEHVKRNFEKPERHNLLGYIRRSKLNEEMITIGDRFKVHADWKPYGRGSGYYVLISSKRIFLIICVVRSRRSMVREAEYRRILARFNETSQQKFSFMPQSLHADNNQHLCILIHGRRKGKNYPAFAEIAFPDKNFTHWMCRLNLFQEFPELVQKLIIEPEVEAQPRQRMGRTDKERSA